MNSTQYYKNRKLRAIDLFAGCGGLSFGLKEAGFSVIGAVELDFNAAATYKKNHRKGSLLCQDIRKVEPELWMGELGLKAGELDLLAGCPPCQGFSTLRTRNGAKRNADRRNTLARQMLRFVTVFRPKAVMMENVPGLRDRQVFNEFRKGLKELGYKVNWDVKDVRFYGVPQRRRRLILLAGLGFEIPFAHELEKFKTVRQAIHGLPQAGNSGDPLHDFPEARSEKVRNLISRIPKDGGSRLALPKEEQLPCHQECDGFKDIYGRMAWDKVSPTITSGCFNPSKGRFLHPEEDRCITMREAALLQSFPARFKVPKFVNKTDVALMLGNALPPEFIRRHAVEIHKAVMMQQSSTSGAPWNEYHCNQATR